MGAGRNRSEADPQGRRLREQEHSIFGPLRAGSSGPRRPQSGRRPQVHSARGVAGAGPGMRAGRGGRVHRQRSRARVRSREGTVVSHAGRREPDSGTRETGSGNHGGGQSHRRRRDGFRRQGLADRLQDHRREPAAGELFRFRRVRLLGVSPAGRAPGRVYRRDHRVAVSRSGACSPEDGRGRRISAKRPRSCATRAAYPKPTCGRSRSATWC